MGLFKGAPKLLIEIFLQLCLQNSNKKAQRRELIRRKVVLGYQEGDKDCNRDETDRRDRDRETAGEETSIRM